MRGHPVIDCGTEPPQITFSCSTSLLQLGQLGLSSVILLLQQVTLLQILQLLHHVERGNAKPTNSQEDTSGQHHHQAAKQCCEQYETNNPANLVVPPRFACHIFNQGCHLTHVRRRFRTRNPKPNASRKC